MAWDFEKFLAQYKEGECDNVRCLNRRHTLIEQGRELLDAKMLLSKIMERAKEDATDSQVAREIYRAIGLHNLGYHDHASDLPREGQPQDSHEQEAA
ncbi:hypothetical protein [Streptomyces decoyicus]|uniref:hypothetical protein n=1 Tax=Streptomyces decoyicus TaxID=249567 RepID=UPI0033B0787F